MNWIVATAVSAVILTPNIHGADNDSEVSAVEMRQYCRGMEAASLESNGMIELDPEKYPDVLECFGASETLHQETLAVNENDSSLFLPGVCASTNGRGTQAFVLMKVFTHYVDEHPEEGGGPFMIVAWRDLRSAFPCTASKPPARRAPGHVPQGSPEDGPAGRSPLTLEEE